MFALERNKVTNFQYIARFIRHTSKDAVYISPAAAVTNDCLLFYAADGINTATVYHVPWVVDFDWAIASVLRIICGRCFRAGQTFKCSMRQRVPHSNTTLSTVLLSEEVVND